MEQQQRQIKNKPLDYQQLLGVHIEERIKYLEEKEAYQIQLEQKMEEQAKTASQKIILDIGSVLGVVLLYCVR